MSDGVRDGPDSGGRVVSQITGLGMRCRGADGEFQSGRNRRHHRRELVRTLRGRMLHG